jgi:hypothetical protein
LNNNHDLASSSHRHRVADLLRRAFDTNNAIKLVIQWIAAASAYLNLQMSGVWTKIRTNLILDCTDRVFFCTLNPAKVLRIR